MIGLKKNDLGWNIITEFVALRPKSYSYLINDGNSDKKAKATVKCVIKRILKLNKYKNCLLNNEVILKSQRIFKSESYKVYTEEINKVSLSSNVIRDYKLLIKYHYILKGILH